MSRVIKTLWIASEEVGPTVGSTGPTDDNTDIIVEFTDGSRYVATFFTYNNIERLRKSYAATGECLHGKYFWASDMILIDRIDRESIMQVIAELELEGCLDHVFTKADLAPD